MRSYIPLGDVIIEKVLSKNSRFRCFFSFLFSGLFTFLEKKKTKNSKLLLKQEIERRNKNQERLDFLLK